LDLESSVIGCKNYYGKDRKRKMIAERLNSVMKTLASLSKETVSFTLVFGTLNISQF
jgi:hypothetical protein